MAQHQREHLLEPQVTSSLSGRKREEEEEEELCVPKHSKHPLIYHPVSKKKKAYRECL